MNYISHGNNSRASYHYLAAGVGGEGRTPHLIASALWGRLLDLVGISLVRPRCVYALNSGMDTEIVVLEFRNWFQKVLAVNVGGKLNCYNFNLTPCHSLRMHASILNVGENVKFVDPVDLLSKCILTI